MGRKIFALIVALLFFYITSPLLLPVIMGGIFAVLFDPLLERAEKRKIPPALSAAILTLAVVVLVMLPIGSLIFFGAKSGFRELQTFKQQGPGTPASGDWIDALIDTPRLHSLLIWISKYFPANVAAIADTAHDLVQTVSTKLGDLLGQFVAALPGMIMALAVTTVSLFFFLMDGKNLVLFFRRNSLFNHTQTDQMLAALSGMCRSVIMASVVSGLVQSIIMLAAGLSLGIPNAALVAAVVFVASFVPVIGSVPITLGITIQQFFLYGSTRGIVMLIFAIMIATVDNMVRPMFLRGSTNLHPLLAFVAAFGGLQTFGFMGVFLGPIIAALFVVTVQILLKDPEGNSKQLA